MIDPAQLAEALGRIDPRDREVLALSLRRRVPDEALGRMYDVEPGEVARLRAAALERLAEQLGVRRGADFGAVLTALLEEETWSAAGPARAPGDEFAAANARGQGPVAPVAADLAPAEPAPADPPPAGPASADPPDRRPAEDGPPDGAPDAAPPPAPPPAWPEPSRRRAPHLAFAIFGIGVAAFIAAITWVEIGQVSDDGRASEGGSDTGDGTRQFVPEASGPMAAPFPSDPAQAACYETAAVEGEVTVRTEPRGKPLARLARRTEWGSPRVLGVVSRDDGWLGVQASELPNGEVGWLRESAVESEDCVRWSLHADLSRRLLYVRHDGHTIRKMEVAIGRPGNATPEGRFTVTDRLKVTDPSSSYGCCVLALTGHQTRLPDSWPGGDRLAVHATADLETIGRPASLGCLRAVTRHARWLIDRIPLGAPIFIRS
jgi:hypothetical protein